MWKDSQENYKQIIRYLGRKRVQSSVYQGKLMTVFDAGLDMCVDLQEAQRRT